MDWSPAKRTAIARLVVNWFNKNSIELPWRDQVPNPYRVWISEIMLQQTQIVTVIGYFERFMTAFPAVEDLAQAQEDQVLKLWEGLGYYSRARNLHKAAKMVVGQWGGEFPKTAAQWLLLSGVGRYSAGAITSIVYGQQASVLDGNVKRVLTRLLDCHDIIDQTRTVNYLWDVADSLVPKKKPGDFNQGLMEIGERVCTRNPSCETCPLKKHCQSYVAGTSYSLPKRKKKKKVPHRSLVIAVIKRRGKYLVGRRPTDGMLGGLWEFPEIKLEGKKPDKIAALVSGVHEQLNLQVSATEKITSISHAYTHFTVDADVYFCEVDGGRLKPSFHSQTKWVSPSEIDDYSFPGTNHKFLKLL